MRVPVWTILPLFLLIACQSAPPQDTPRKPCPPRLQESGQCNAGSFSSFPELGNVQ